MCDLNMMAWEAGGRTNNEGNLQSFGLVCLVGETDKKPRNQKHPSNQINSHAAKLYVNVSHRLVRPGLIHPLAPRWNAASSATPVRSGKVEVLL